MKVLLDLSRRNEQLEESVARKSTNSSNSSKPPSSDGFVKPPKRRRAQDGEPKRKPGGQKGHKGVTRELFPVDQANKTLPFYPENCKKCGAPAPDNPTSEMFNSAPIRHQQLEIPPNILEITECQRFGFECSCGTTTWAELPVEWQSGFGPRLTAILSYLTAAHRISRRGAVDLLKTIFRVPISTGSVSNLLEQAAKAVNGTYEELAAKVPSLPFVNTDETSWPVGLKLSWLWIFVAPLFVVYKIGARNAETLMGVIGESFQGILCCDRFSAYFKAHGGVFQFCWAHLIRNFKGLMDTCSKEDAQRFCQRMLGEAKRLFEIWHLYTGGDITRSELIRLSKPIRARFGACLKTYAASDIPKVRNFARNLLLCWDGLFTFLYYEGVEPTNNSAERGVRAPVMWRRICQGNKTERGAWVTERLLTVIYTCRMQGRDRIEFLTEAIAAHRRGLPAPSLLPTDESQIKEAA
ncbi:IS66 family transposase [Thermodesulfobacteriota bacterium]